eukprot:scaffold129786_cov52-Attheya_sp.AAC.1
MKEAESKLLEWEKEIALLKKVNEERDEEIAILKKAKEKLTEELTQKTTEQAASFMESESRREQLKSTFELKCEKLSKANADIQYQHTILMLKLKSEFAKRIDSLEEELARNASKDAIALSSPLRYTDFLNGAHFSKYTNVFSISRT